MSNKYVSKFPKVITDANINSAIDGMIKKFTIEEYYDLYHHTHDVSSLATPEGSMTYDQMQNSVTNLQQITEQMNNMIQQQQEVIEQQNNIIKKMEADVTEFKQIVAAQNEVITVMKKEIENMPPISDWDVTEPGVQDAEGNTLGELMGFTMTEI